jgi:hypothetical protein
VLHEGSSVRSLPRLFRASGHNMSCIVVELLAVDAPSLMQQVPACRVSML